MRRARRCSEAIVVGLVAAGCMKIYADPELPDVEVEWTDADCSTGATDVALVLVNRDDGTRVETRTPCSDLGAAFVDVSRERYALQGLSLDLAADVVSSASAEIDVRNGLDERANLYFATQPNFRVAWTFDTGATCASLDAAWMVLDFTLPGGETTTLATLCELTPHFGGVFPDGTYTLALRAIADDNSVVATSEPSAPLAITATELTDFGTLSLTSTYLRGN